MLATDALAQRPGQQRGPLARMIHQHFAKHFQLKEELGLTDEQKDSLHKILRDHRDELQPVVKGVVDQHRTLREAVLADEPDEEAIRAAANQLETAIGNAAVAASEVVAELKGVLTAEQLQKLRDFHADQEMAVDEFMKHLGDE